MTTRASRMERDIAVELVKRTYQLRGAAAATDHAAELLATGRLNTSDYMYLVRWSEGR